LNILDAKNEIKNTVKMYLHKSELGDYLVSIRRQRPIFLVGPPGIGKTEIVSQVASELDLGFVNYTITHHTRQSAIGLPTIQEKTFDNREFSLTRYTLSEIIASVYDAIETQNKLEGILFIDEINCVSESLAPAILDLLQNKKFGPHKIPKGWILVTAGNPVEFNRSAREFDMVTLDRLKLINVTTDYDVWKRYAYRHLFSEDILSYLTYREKNLFYAEKTPHGMMFVTPRGWEDLSQALIIYQELKIEVTLELITQYIQFDDIAREFYRFYLLYRKYKKNYDISAIFKGDYEASIPKFKESEFDERFAIIEVLLSALNQEASKTLEDKQILSNLKQIFINLQNKDSFDYITQEITRLNNQIKSLDFNPSLIRQNQKLIESLNVWLHHPKLDLIEKHLKDYEKKMEANILSTALAIENCLIFVSKTFGEGQELVAMMVNMLASIHIMRFVTFKQVKIFYELNSKLLIEGNHKEIIEEIESLKSETA